MRLSNENIVKAGPWVYNNRGPKRLRRNFSMPTLLGTCQMLCSYGYRALGIIAFVAVSCNPDNPPLQYTMQEVLAHNDYQKPEPFYHAYSHQVGVIEADLYFDEGRVKVAHDPSELEKDMDLESLYLIPLKEKIREHGRVYPDENLSLALMLDIKNETAKVMARVLELVEKYPELFGSDRKDPLVPLVISGARPDQASWASLPAPILIDGRLTDDIPDSLKSRIFMVSSSFSSVVPGSFDQSGLTDEQLNAVKDVVDSIHRQNLKIRFWGVPDHIDFWKLQDQLEVDIIGSDHLDELAKHIR